MKRIIKGRVYDSSTARKLAMRWTGTEFDRTGWEELYLKKNGEHFLLCHRYSVNVERITPLTYEEARLWAENHLDCDEYEEIFGDVAEDDSRVSLNLSMTAAEADIIKRNAAKAGMTVSAYIVHRCAE